MHDQIRHDIDQAIESMSDAEKLELIEELARSVRADKKTEGGETALGQNQRLLPGDEDAADLGVLSESGLKFWDNEIDDEVWNNALPPA